MRGTGHEYRALGPIGIRLVLELSLALGGPQRPGSSFLLGSPGLRGDGMGGLLLLLGFRSFLQAPLGFLQNVSLVGGQPFLHACLVAEGTVVLGLHGLVDDDGPQLAPGDSCFGQVVALEECLADGLFVPEPVGDGEPVRQVVPAAAGPLATAGLVGFDQLGPLLQGAASAPQNR